MTESILKKLREAQALVTMKRPDEAAVIYQSILADEPQNSVALSGLAHTRVLSNDYKNAVMLGQQAIAADPENDFAFYIMSFSLLQQQQSDESVKAIREAIRLDPNEMSYRALLIRALIQAGEETEAVQEGSNALALQPDDAEVLGATGLAWYALGNFEEALNHLYRALEQSPDDYTLHRAVAEVLKASGQHKAAEQSFRDATRLQPTDRRNVQGIATAQAGQTWWHKIIYFPVRFYDSYEEQGLGIVLIAGGFALRYYEKAIAAQSSIAILPALIVWLMALLLFAPSFLPRAALLPVLLNRELRRDFGYLQKAVIIISFLLYVFELGCLGALLAGGGPKVLYSGLIAMLIAVPLRILYIDAVRLRWQLFLSPLVWPVYIVAGSMALLHLNRVKPLYLFLLTVGAMLVSGTILILLRIVSRRLVQQRGQQQ
jgi:tetratricopeptide (TPR) repeat protein